MTTKRLKSTVNKGAEPTVSIQANQKPKAKVNPPPKRKIQRRSEEVREKILDIALNCFGEKGFDGTSTRIIAKDAGITHTLVIYHFESKEKLWKATVENVLNKYISLSKITHLQEEPKQWLMSFIEEFVRFSAKYPQIHRIFTAEGNQGSPRMKWVIDYFLRDYYQQVIKMIRLGQDQEVVRQCDPTRLYYLIVGVGSTSFTIGTEYKALTGKDVFSEAELLRNTAFIYEIFFT